MRVRKSSNYKEFWNLIVFLEDFYSKQLLDGCKIFMLINNTTVEAAFNRRTSSRSKLISLIIILIKIELTILPKW